MSIIKKLLNSIFSKSSSQEFDETISPSSNAFWRLSPFNRLRVYEKSFNPWLINFINEKQKINFSWDSGRDEAFLEIHEFEGQDPKLIENLEDYLITKLEIPDVGDFAMEGEGFLFIANDLIQVNYASKYKEIIDYIEETEADIYGEIINESKEMILFKIN